MSDPKASQAGQLGWRDRIEARRAGFSRQQLAVVIAPTDPRRGSATTGHALLTGHFQFGQTRVVVPAGNSLWAPQNPPPDFETGRQEFGWLDDLAAEGSPAALRTARLWTREWIRRFGPGRGPGWTLPQVSHRLGQIIDHAEWLTVGDAALPKRRLERVLARHQRFVIRRFEAMPEGLPGLEVCCRLIVAGSALDLSERLVSAAQTELEHACRDAIGPDGGIASRAPEALAGALCDLARAAEMLRAAGVPIRPHHRQALRRMVPCVRTLRHSDGTMARFHGGGAGDVARLDAALAGLGRVPGVPGVRAMGFVRLARGGTSVIVDCAAPPAGPGSRGGHASTLAFEMCSGRWPLIVSSGPGGGASPDQPRAARQTAASSTVCLKGTSSSRFGIRRAERGDLVEPPGDVQTDLRTDGLAARMVAAHNGYVAGFGLIHVRRLDLDLEGNSLRGEELLSAVTDLEQRFFHEARGNGPGIPFVVRFHLHPDVSADLDETFGDVTLNLGRGEVWVFRHDRTCTIRLDPDVYLENTAPEPRATRQIVLDGLARTPETPVKWSLTREARAPAFVRRAGDDTGETEISQA